MRKLFIIILVIVFSIVGLRYFVISGNLERYIDNHPNPQLNSTVEYYWAKLLDSARHIQSAKHRYNRVINKYPESEFAPLARASLVNLLIYNNENNAAIVEGKVFLEKYPNHPKASQVKRRISVLEYGY